MQTDKQTNTVNTEGYDVRDGIIRSPGKFEGEPVYALYFWEAYLNGGADEDDGEVMTFDVSDVDRDFFPELKDVSRVFMSTSTSGFVYTSTETI